MFDSNRDTDNLEEPDLEQTNTENIEVVEHNLENIEEIIESRHNERFASPFNDDWQNQVGGEKVNDKDK